MRERPKLGEILVTAGIIDEIQLKAALGEQARWGRRLGVTLIKMGMVEEGHLIRALAKQLDMPVASLAGKRIPAEVLALVPARVASQHGVIPLFTRGAAPSTQLFLGMEDPSNLGVLDDLAFRTGMEIHPVMIGPTELGEAIDRYYHDRRSGPPASDPFHNADAISAGSLRIVTDDAPQPGTVPIGSPASRPGAPTDPSPSPARSRATSEPVADAPRALPPASSARESEIELCEAIARMPEGLEDDIARALAETERTRIVAKAITQLLIEKGIVTLAELQSEIAALKAASRDAKPATSTPPSA